ncbi:MAG: CocE/NonD family hydrolase [Acidimicrobiales bacterium]
MAAAVLIVLTTQPYGHTARADASTGSARTSSTVLQLPPQVMAASAAPGRSWTPEPASYGVGSELNVPVTMADGTVLRADVFYPTSGGNAAPGPFPVLMTQTPYGKSTPGVGGADNYLVSRGYIDVIADVRGTGDSQGQFGLFDPVQSSDGATLVRWAAALPHSSGKVGLYGASYLGIDQLRTAGAVGPNSPLKAIFPVVSATDLYRDTAFMGGMLDSEFGVFYLGLTSGLNIVNPLTTGVTDPGSLAGLTQVEIDHLTDLATFDAQFAAGTVAGGPTAYNGTYWQSRLPADALPSLVTNGIPAYFVGGEYDLFQRGEPLNYAALQNLANGRPANAPMVAGEKVTGRYQLWDGPFTHLGAALLDFDPLELRWFDTWLKGIDTGMADTPTPLHYYDLGTSTYTETTTFPFTGLTPTRYYLAPGRSGSFATSPNDGTLTTTPPTVPSGQDTLLWSPVGSPCGSSVDQWVAGPIRLVQQAANLPNLPCLQDDRLTQLGPSILNYTTAPMAKPVTLGGPIAATIYATATTKDSQWVAEIEDVAPDGTARPLTEGALLGSLRQVDQSRTWTAPDGAPLLPYHPYTSGSIAPVTPGAVERYDIEIFPTLDTVAAGHRIRLTITTADSPHLQPTIPETVNLVGGIYQVQRSAAAPSSVELPLGTVNGAPATTGTPQTGQTATKGPATGRSLLAYTGTNETVALLAAAIALLAAAALALRRRVRSASQRREDMP